MVWDDATLSEQAAASGRTKATDSTCARPSMTPDIIPFPADRITRTKILGGLINEYDTAT